MTKAVVVEWGGLYLTTDAILGEIMNITVVYTIADLSVNETRSVQFTVSPLDTQATVKSSAAAAIIADAAAGGYTLSATDIRFQDGTRGVA